jgi:HAE1 family hydrophobic/amphiphilic exporter-1
MTLSDLSIQRPVLTWVMNLGLIVFGVLGLVRLGVDQFPDMEFPRAMVQARLEGANPEGIEEDVTEVLEEHLNSIAGLREISSVSSPGAATISLEFELGTDIDVAIQDVRDKLGFARFFLPRDLEPPVVSKMDMHRSAVLWIPTQTGRTRVESSEMLRYVVKPAMETIPGVSGATIFGQQDRNIRIWLNGEALRARGLAANDVLSAIQREHVEVPAGSIEGPRLDYAVKTMAEYESLDALRDMVIAHAEGAPVRLGDVARVEDAGEELTTLARFWGEESIGLGIMKQSGANTVAIADAVYERIDQLNRSLPHDFQIHTREKLIDFSKPIRESVDETNFALFTGALLAVITVFVFLRRWRPTLIVAAAIPLSLIATFGVTFLMGFTLNTMTLLAMALAVGVVIDDAIVVLENIERHRESGEESFEAAHRGTREIAFAATACTFSIAVVFLPAAFASGMVGNFLGEFGLTVAAAVILSLFVALTLTPMLAARVPPARERAHGSIYHYLEIGFQRLEQGYRAALAWVFAHRGVTLAGAAGSLAVSFILFGSLGKEFFPPSDQGLLMVQYETPPGSSLEHTHAMAQKLERWLLEQPELSGLFAAVGGGGPGMSRSHYTGVFASILKPKEERERSVQEFARDAREVFATVPGIRARVMDMSSMMSGGSRDGAFAVELRGNLSLEQLDEVSDRFMAALWERGGFVDMDKSLKLGLPELQVIPDRDKAAELGVDAATLGTVVRAMIGGMDVASFKDAGRRHDIRVRLDEADRATPEAVERLYVRTKGGDVVELRNLVDVHMGAAPSDISRTQRQRSVRVMSNLTTEKRLGDAIEDARIVAAEVLPEEVSLAFSGQAEQLLESFEQFGFSMALAVIVIYLVLAAQFESFVHPLTVMLALPLAMVGALGALFVFGMTINLFSLIGIIMLFGLVTKNSILLVDYANHLRREEGLEKSEAMRRAAPIRLRPVLMTAVSMIFGVLPAAIGLGPGAESRQPMAVATAAGMLSSTVLTLLVVPVFYVVFEDGIDWLKGRLRALRGARPEDRPADRLAHARTGARPGEL